MNVLNEVLNHPLANQLGLALLHSLWQGALVGVGFGLCRYLFRGRSAQLRYVVGCVALVILVVWPTVTFIRGAAATYRTSQPLVMDAAGGQVGFSDGGMGGDFGGGTEAVMNWGADRMTGAMPWVVIVWVLGVMIFSIRLTRSYWWVRTIRTRDNEPVGDVLLEKLDDLRERLGVSRPVRLLKSALVEVPTVVGWLRPVILMPAASLSGLAPQQLETILAHELAHVRRFDYLVNGFQCAVETLMFYHPVVWWSSRVIREEREHCCDDLVIQVCGDRMAYARALATLEEYRGDVPEFAFAASGGSLPNRIRRVFGMPEKEDPSGRARLGGLVLVGVGMVLVILGGYLMFSPKKYEAVVRIKVERVVSLSGFSENQSPTVYDPYFLQTEFEVIESGAVLNRVIESLDLTDAWGKRYNAGVKLEPEAAQALLKKRISLRTVRNTSLIMIGVLDDYADETAKIANEIARQYGDLRLEQFRDSTQKGIKALQASLDDQEFKVAEVRRRMDDYREKLGISPLEAGETGPDKSLDVETFKRLQTLRVDKEAELEQQQMTLGRLKNMSEDELKQVLPTTVTDTLLMLLLEQQSQASSKLVQLRKDFAEESPTMVNARAQLDDLDKKVKERITGILKAMENNVATLESGTKTLDDLIAKNKAASVEKAQRWTPYFDAKQQLEEMLRFRQAIYLKLAAVSTDVQLPKMLVEVVDAALPPRYATSPNRALAGALVVLGLLLDMAGLVTVTAARRSRRVEAAR